MGKIFFWLILNINYLFSVCGKYGMILFLLCGKLDNGILYF